jgi:hypothetical protein
VPLWRAVTPARHRGRPSDAGANRGLRRWRWTTVLVFACLGLVTSACSSTPAAGKDSTTTSTSSTVTTTTVASQAKAVLAGYRAEQAAFEQAIRTANAYSQALPATMVNPQLQPVRRYLVVDAHDGIVGRGSVSLHPRLSPAGRRSLAS